MDQILATAVGFAIVLGIVALAVVVLRYFIRLSDTLEEQRTRPAAPMKSRLHPVTFLVLAMAGFLALLASSIVRLSEVGLDGARASDYVQTIGTTSIALVALLALVIGRQVPAAVYAALMSTVGRKPTIVVRGEGLRGLDPDDTRKGGFFSRCLVADANGLRLWRPFRSSTLAWRDVAQLRAESRADIAARELVIRIVRRNSDTSVILVPRSNSLLEWAVADRRQVSRQLRRMRAVAGAQYVAR